jgi:hypothetical protein
LLLALPAEGRSARDQAAKNRRRNSLPTVHEDASQATVNPIDAAPGSDDWRARSRELREEFFTLMGRLADKEITTTVARIETTRINREIATLMKLTTRKRD